MSKISLLLKVTKINQSLIKTWLFMNIKLIFSKRKRYTNKIPVHRLGQFCPKNAMKTSGSGSLNLVLVNLECRYDKIL